MNLNLQTGRLLSEFSTFGIGGPIHLCAEIRTIEEMEAAFRFARVEKLPFLVVGKGSNCLFDDEGFGGLVLLNKIDFCHWDESTIRVGAGYPFSLLGVQSAKRSLAGLEFASGIPASVGGAIFMNAGANGQETSATLRSVFYLHADGTSREYAVRELIFGYRTSSFQKMDGAILAATFELMSSEKARSRQLQIVERRIHTQPLKDKSIGCIFRNPRPDLAAGALIEKCGLKGLLRGQVKVSEVHANFIVNMGGGRAQEVKELIRIIQTAVKEKTGIGLEPEIRVIGHGR